MGGAGRDVQPVAGGVGPPAPGRAPVWAGGEPLTAEEGIQFGLGGRLRAGPGGEGGVGHASSLQEEDGADMVSSRGTGKLETRLS